MKPYKWVLAVAVVAFATLGVAAATADAPTITGFPNQIRTASAPCRSFRRVRAGFRPRRAREPEPNSGLGEPSCFPSPGAWRVRGGA